jgi:hypothetical protein
MSAAIKPTYDPAHHTVPLRTLVTHDTRPEDGPPGHDRQSRASVARHLAEVLGWTFGGAYEAGAAHPHPLYFVPHDALLATEAEALGIRGLRDLFGGVVPHAFIATKAITHPLVDRNAVAPVGWSHAFADRIGDEVLRGYTTFSLADARRAAMSMLPDGPVRLKCVSGIGGAGQHLVRTPQEVDAVLAGIDPREFDAGVTVEENLDEDKTFSVGCVECGGETIAYCGTQRTTRNSREHEVYGGSTLDVVRGGFGALLTSGLSAERREAVELARAYDAAAFAAYPDAFASRRNYDVLFGHDHAGRRRAGVLEQSWRIGGASGAEVLALAAFRRDPARTRVRCATVEIYGDDAQIPAGAIIHFRGVDEHVGPLVKYAVELDGDDA